MLYSFEAFILWHRFFVPLTLAVFDVWGRLAETGSRNKSQLVAIESARLEQRRGMLTFDEIMKYVVYCTANFHDSRAMATDFGTTLAANVL